MDPLLTTPPRSEGMAALAAPAAPPRSEGMAALAPPRSACLQFWTERMLRLNPDWCWPKWCLGVYEKDLLTYPTPVERNTEALLQVHTDPDTSYLKYFRNSRGYSRPLGCYPYIWELMVRSNLVLYYPQYFFYLISQNGGVNNDTYPEDQQLMSQLEALAQLPTYAIVNNSSYR